MTDQQILDLLNEYEGTLRALGYQEIEADHEINLQVYWQDVKKTSLQHVLSMIPVLRSFLAAGKMEKVMRWLGFIQGIFWMNGLHTLNALRSHNRSS